MSIKNNEKINSQVVLGYFTVFTNFIVSLQNFNNLYFTYGDYIYYSPK